MSTDDLSSPLGQQSARRRRRLRLPFSGVQFVTVTTGAFVLGFAGFAIFNTNPMGGEPITRVELKPVATPEAGKPGAVAKVESTPVATPDSQRTITIIDGSSGARTSVQLPGGGASGADSNADVPAAEIDSRLLETSRYGLVPISADGLKPFEVYASTAGPVAAKASTLPVVAVVVGGLGVGAAKSNDAILRLPPEITLGFTPYGNDTSKLVETARANRHEVLLQVPMEPFDYPDNDPGPQTLLATATKDQNLDRLTWHMSRFQGYIGIANFMGARFVATDAALQPIIDDANKRGLAYFDDGSSPRSTAGAAANSRAMPFARADVTLDAAPSSAEIDAALGRLERLARERGTAIGVASALPISIERLSAWAKTLESRGILLVPLSLAMQRPQLTPRLNASILYPDAVMPNGAP